MAHSAGRSIAQRVALVAILAGALAVPARADPEGYQGGEGRPVGTPHESGGVSLTVRGIAVTVARPGSAWSCDGLDVRAARGIDLVTVSLAVGNPSEQAVSTQLALMDLVVADPDGAVHVLEGTCVKPGHADVISVSLDAHRSTIVPVQFLVPRGTAAKILVYNDDDFPALFALPAPRRRSAKVR